MPEAWPIQVILDVLIGQLICTHVHTLVNMLPNEPFGYMHLILHLPALQTKEYLWMIPHFL